MAYEGEADMSTRASDGAGPFRISRSISPLQLAVIVSSIFVSGAGAYAGFKSLETSVGQMSTEVKELGKAAAATNIVNAVQDRNIADIDRRVTIIETRIMAGSPPPVPMHR